MAGSTQFPFKWSVCMSISSLKTSQLISQSFLGQHSWVSCKWNWARRCIPEATKTHSSLCWAFMHSTRLSWWFFTNSCEHIHLVSCYVQREEAFSLIQLQTSPWKATFLALISASEYCLLKYFQLWRNVIFLEEPRFKGMYVFQMFCSILLCCCQ